MLGLLALVWALWLVYFDTYHVSPVIIVLRTWVPQWALVTWAATGGVGLLFVTPPGYRRPIHLLMCSFWIFIACSIAATDIAMTGIPVYSAVGILHSLKYILSPYEH